MELIIKGDEVEFSLLCTLATHNWHAPCHAFDYEIDKWEGCNLEHGTCLEDHSIPTSSTIC